jgi:hypothetical protein
MNGIVTSVILHKSDLRALRRLAESRADAENRARVAASEIIRRLIRQEAERRGIAVGTTE